MAASGRGSTATKGCWHNDRKEDIADSKTQAEQDIADTNTIVADTDGRKAQAKEGIADTSTKVVDAAKANRASSPPPCVQTVTGLPAIKWCPFHIPSLQTCEICQAADDLMGRYGATAWAIPPQPEPCTYTVHKLNGQLLLENVGYEAVCDHVPWLFSSLVIGDDVLRSERMLADQVLREVEQNPHNRSFELMLVIDTALAMAVRSRRRERRSERRWAELKDADADDAEDDEAVRRWHVLHANTNDDGLFACEDYEEELMQTWLGSPALLTVSE